MADRIPPHNLRAEESLLGAMLCTATAIDNTAGICGPDDYYKPAHAHIANAIAELHAVGEPADTVTVHDHLNRAGLIDAIGGASTLTTLQANTPATSNAERYARIVADMALLRRLAATAATITQLAYDTPDDVPGAVDQAEELLYQLSANRHDAHESRPIGEHLETWLDRMERLYERGEPDGVMTGLVDLDRLLLGLRPGQLITVCARPGVGKSAFGLGVAIYAGRNNHPTLLVNVEMSSDETMDRAMASEALIDLQRIRSGKLIEKDWPRISTAVGNLSEIGVYTLDDPGATITTIRSDARRRAARGGLDLIVVDYVQLLDGPRGENRQVEVSALSRGLKRLARDLKIPVIALAQLNRNLEMRADKRPQLADLRESGAIENDSDIVIGLYRDEMYHPDSKDAGIIEILILKQRNGPTGTVTCAWMGQYNRIANMARV